MLIVLDLGCGFVLLVFKGIQKTTLIDFPGKVASTFFLPECNFRCPFCYNKQLVFDEATGVKITEAEALSFLEERKGFLDGVCITGGEPLMTEGLWSFCGKVKEIGLDVKLDTNGSFPTALKELVEGNLVDFVAMDIKSSLEGYEKAAGTKVNLDAIKESASFLMSSGVEYEFRMTVLPSMHSEKDMRAIGEWLEGAGSFYLQQFNSSVPLIDESLQGSTPFSRQELEEFAALLKPFFKNVGIRGL